MDAEERPRAQLKAEAEVRPYSQDQPAAAIQRPWHQGKPKGQSKGKKPQPQILPKGKGKRERATERRNKYWLPGLKGKGARKD
jgi:hypothetical protein